MDPEYLHWLCSVPIGATIAVFGLIGNLISMLVWYRITKSKLRGNQSTALYLIALGICDSGLLVFFLLTDTIRMNHPQLDENYHYAAFFSWFGYPAFFFFLVASIWLVVGVTINRWVMITFPTRVRSIYSNPRTKGGIAAFIIFALIVNIPHFLTYHPAETNGGFKLSLTSFGLSDGSIKYEFWVHCIVLVLAPWFSVAVLNAMIIYKLSQQMKKFSKEKGSKKMSKMEEQERKMTRMLLFCTFTFLVLLAWQCIAQCFFMLGVGKNTKPPHSDQWTMVNTAFAVAKLGVVINSSINWIFYCLSGSTFRKEMKKMFCGAATKTGNNSSTSFRTSKMMLSQDSSVVFSNSNSNDSSVVITNEKF